MVNAYLVYGLVDPRSGELRYVGKSSTGLKRPGQHTLPSVLKVEGHLPKARWARQLLAVGLKPEVEVLERHETAEALADAERHFIAYFRSIGCNLTNLTDGGEGEGPFRGMRHLASSRLKTSLALRGRRHSEAHTEKVAAAKRGVHQSAETCILKSRARGVRPFVDQNGVVYQTQNAAARLLGLHVGSLNGVLRGRRKHVGGFTFRYVE